MLRLRYNNIILAPTTKLNGAITTVRNLSSSTTANEVDPTSPLLKFYTTTPPIKPWPTHLFPRRLVSMITCQQNLDLALQIFLYAGKYHPNFSNNYETYHAIIHRLTRARAFDTVESLLAQLRDSKLKCGENIFIDVIRQYGMASLPESSIKTFLRIKKYGVNTSVRSLNTLLNALVQNKRYDLAHAVFKSCKHKFDIVPNVFTCNILIKALCKKNDVEGALKVLDEMPGMGLVPNLVTYTTILGGYAWRRDMESAKRVFSMILDKGWMPDATTYTVLMDGYCKVGKLEEAIKVMDDMEDNLVEANEVTYGVMIEAFCRVKKSGEARDLLDDMLKKKYVPSSSICCKVIDVLCEDDKVEDACELWKRLLRNNVMPDNAISSTLIHWLCKDGKIWEAKKLFGEFEKGSIPSLLTYNTLIAGMCEKGELGEAGQLWDDMVEKGLAPNAFTYNMLITGFCKTGNPKEGIKILEEMVEKKCIPSKSTYSILIEGLYDSGEESKVHEVLSLAMSSGGIDGDSWDYLLTRVVNHLDDGKGALDKLSLDEEHSELIADSYWVISGHSQMAMAEKRSFPVFHSDNADGIKSHQKKGPIAAVFLMRAHHNPTSF
ncbi:hypothetical protein ACFE04_019080 [Oxalis oulophora]